VRARDHRLLLLLGRLLERVELRLVYAYLVRQHPPEPPPALLYRLRVHLPDLVHPLLHSRCADRRIRLHLPVGGGPHLVLFPRVVLVHAPPVLGLPPLQDQVIGRDLAHRRQVVCQWVGQSCWRAR